MSPMGCSVPAQTRSDVLDVTEDCDESNDLPGNGSQQIFWIVVILLAVKK